MKTSVIVAVGLALSGCASINSLRTDLSAPLVKTNLEERALTNNLKKAYQGCSTAMATTCQMNVSLNAAQRAEFVGAGFALSDYYCDIFFRQTNAGARHRRFARNLNNDVGGAIATILGLAKAGSGVVGGVAAGFSLADGSFRNYDESFLVDADLAKLRRLVLAAQDNMKLQIRDKPPGTVFDAESTIIRYAGLCSFLGMQDLLNDSVAAKTATIENDNKTRQGDTPAAPSPSPTPARPAAPTPPAALPAPAGPTPSVAPPAPVT